MNQNLPPNQPGQSGDYSSGQAANPYYSEPPPGEQPNLDANAPLLKNDESQKINTKALLFLGGIVLLLILMTVLVVMSGDDEEEKKDSRAQQEQVVTPERPTSLRDPLDPLAAEPVPVDQYPPVPAADPIPVEPNPQQNQANANRDPYGSAPPEQPRGPTLAERRMGASEGGGGYGGGASGQNEDPVAAMMRSLQAANGGGAAAAPQTLGNAVVKVDRARFLTAPDTLLLRGTYIRCVLETRIITDLPGFTSCIVTEPVYSVNGRSLLLPKGSKVSGKYSGEPSGPRVAVVWDRVTTPTGIDVNMESPGVDNLGSSGHPGDYNAHWVSKISSALFISLLSDTFKYFGEKEGPTTQQVTTGGEVVNKPFESNTARAVERLANQAVAKAAQRPATVTINQGTVVNIYVSKDVDFSGVVTAAKR